MDLPVFNTFFTFLLQHIAVVRGAPCQAGGLNLGELNVCTAYGWKRCGYRARPLSPTAFAVKESNLGLLLHVRYGSE